MNQLNNEDSGYYHIVGECGLDAKGNHLTTSREEYVFWLKLGVEFLRHTFGESPQGWRLGVWWAPLPHTSGKFPIICVGFNELSDSEAAMAYADMLGREMEIFNKAVDWNAIASHPRHE